MLEKWNSSYDNPTLNDVFLSADFKEIGISDVSQINVFNFVLSNEENFDEIYYQVAVLIFERIFYGAMFEKS
jgi:hypothetical protein